MKSISIDQIIEKSGDVLEIKQNAESSISEVLPAELAKSTSLVFASQKTLCEKAIENKAAALVLTEAVFAETEKQLPKNVTVWTTKNIQGAMSLILQLFDHKKAFLTLGVHPTAQIHPTAKVSSTAHIGAFSVIEAHAVIGDDTIIFPHVYVGPFCEVGNRCYISSFTTIGSDGFGFFTDKTFTHHKIPQIGKVVIEDDCEFGTHCALDRATLTETRIKRGSKFDNFCHIAHNVTIGENALVAAGFIVAGSAKIGKNFMASGGVHVLGHLSVADNVILSGRAAVTSTIDKSGMYGGYPLEDHRESTKTLASLPRLKILRKQVNKILKHLNLNEEE